MALEPDPAEAFVQDMAGYLSGLDAGIAKADEFAEACSDAAQAAISEARGAGPLDQ